jgi:lipid-binding SYLF domain-containing protein
MAVIGILLLSGCAQKTAGPAETSKAQAFDAAALVERAQLTIEGFAADPQFGTDFRRLAPRAKGIFIAPYVYRGAFIFGAAGGNGLLMARSTAGAWNGPAFYTLGELSIGVQAGADWSEVVLLAMTDRGVNAMLSPSVKLGAEIGITAGPVGGAASAATLNISADIISYARAKGLYLGLSLDGAVVAVRRAQKRADNRREDLTPSAILVGGQPKNPQAEPLAALVARMASGQ